MRQAMKEGAAPPLLSRRFQARVVSQVGSISDRARPFWVEHWPLAVLMTLGCALRWHHLARRLLIFDEFMLLNPFRLNQGLVAYTRGVWSTTTYNPGWIIVTWVTHHLGGIAACRLPSCVAGTLAIGAVYFAARGMGLSRKAGLLAGAVIALGVYQIEYGQQALPYAAMPLGGAVCIGLVTLLSRPECRERPIRQALLWVAFVLSCATMSFIHNSALILFPPVFLYWAWSIVRPASPASESRQCRRPALPWLMAVALVAAASFPWLYAMFGGSDREYLWPFYLGACRNAPIRWFVSDTLNWSDGLYTTQRPLLGRCAGVIDPIYFVVTRTFDLLATYLRAEYLTGIEHPFGAGAYLLPWAYTVAMLAVVAHGVWGALRGRCAPAAGRWVVCFGLTLGLGVVLSALRLFPLGGVRQWLCLSPLLALTAAVGVDSGQRWLSRTMLALGMVWVFGNLQLLPDYYGATLDALPAKHLRVFAERHGVQDIVCADGQPSRGALAQMSYETPSLRVIDLKDPWFAQLTSQQRPFLMCAVSGPSLDPTQADPAPRPDFDSRVLANYEPRSLVSPSRWKHWFTWDVVLYAPMSK